MLSFVSQFVACIMTLSVISLPNKYSTDRHWYHSQVDTMFFSDLVTLAFLGGLSLHLNHLIASRVANYDWPFGTLPFGLFGSNLDTRDLETYPRTYSGHF